MASTMGTWACCQRVTAEQLARLLSCQSEEEFRSYHNHLFFSRPDCVWMVKGPCGITEILNEKVPPGQPPVLDIEHGGTPISRFWAGYRPLRYIAPHEVVEIVQRLRTVGWRTMLASSLPGQELLDPDTYEPDPWDDYAGEREAFPFSDEEMRWEPPGDWRPHLIAACRDLVAVMQAAAQRGDAVLLWIA